jgi:hypothetical protein
VGEKPAAKRIGKKDLTKKDLTKPRQYKSQKEATITIAPTLHL